MIKNPERYPKLLKVRKLKDGTKIQPFVFKTIAQKYLDNDIYKIGYLDIETTGLQADFGFMLTYAVLVRDVLTGKTEIRKGYITKKDLDRARRLGDADKVDELLLKKLMKDMEDIDLWIGHWFIGKHRHDVPFIRSRMAINKVSGFPKYKMVRFGDTQKWSSQIHRLRSNSLGTIGDAYELNTKKTPIKTKDWKKATMFADRKAIKYILHHNVNDVIITYKVHLHIEEYVPIPATYC